MFFANNLPKTLFHHSNKSREGYSPRLLALAYDNYTGNQCLDGFGVALTVCSSFGIALRRGLATTACEGAITGAPARWEG
jgi:hypothetical protein